MLILLSPSKSLDFENGHTAAHTKIRFQKDTQELVDLLKTKKATYLKQLMGISDKLADLNVERYQSFKFPMNEKNAKQAVLAFKGDVYTGLDAENLSDEDLTFAQDHLRILSGLYGVLRPLDLIQPYRLEMGIKLTNAKGKNLYTFWGSKIADLLNEDARTDQYNTIINLASKEYFKAVNQKVIEAKIININFKELRGDTYKIISFNAKKARGLMSRYIIQNRLTEPEAIKAFNLDNYL